MIRNLTRGTVLAEAPRLAGSVSWRVRGMIGRQFAGFDALVFERCWSIHTCFMGMAIDVVFVDRDGVVAGVFPQLRPWRTASVWGARSVLELPAGTLVQHPVAVGDRLAVSMEKPAGGAIL